MATARGQAGRDIKDGSKTEHTHTHNRAERWEGGIPQQGASFRVAVGGGGWRWVEESSIGGCNTNE